MLCVTYFSFYTSVYAAHYNSSPVVLFLRLLLLFSRSLLRLQLLYIMLQFALPKPSMDAFKLSNMAVAGGTREFKRPVNQLIAKLYKYYNISSHHHCKHTVYSYLHTGTQIFCLVDNDREYLLFSQSFCRKQLPSSSSVTKADSMDSNTLRARSFIAEFPLIEVCRLYLH